MNLKGLRKGLCLFIYPFLVFLSGCSLKLGPKFVTEDFEPPTRVAVLPFSNQTNDVSGPEIVRKLLIEMLPTRGYFPIEKEKVDRILLENFGLTDGGQLRSVSPEELGEALGADGLFYGDLLVFVDFPFGFGRKRTVKANLKLVNAKGGNLVWEDEKSWSNPEIYFSAQEAKEALVRQIAERQLAKVTGTFLRQESRKMLALALRNLPLAH